MLITRLIALQFVASMWRVEMKETLENSEEFTLHLRCRGTCALTSRNHNGFTVEMRTSDQVRLLRAVLNESQTRNVIH